MYNNDLMTEAEKAAAVHLARLVNDDDQNPALNRLGKLGYDVDPAEPDWFAAQARAVVAELRPILKAEADTTTDIED